MRMILAAAALALAITATPAMAKKKPEMTPLQVQQIQSHEFEADKDLVFASVMSVLQDDGYRIQAADKDTGLITGVGSSEGKMTYNLLWGFGKSKKTPIASVFLEEIAPTMTRVRINFVMGKIKSTLYGSQPQDEEPILDAATYRDAFEKIGQAVFVRQAMASKASSAAPVPSSATIAPAAATPEATTSPAT